jgi:hypothetical protein
MMSITIDPPISIAHRPRFEVPTVISPVKLHEARG